MPCPNKNMPQWKALVNALGNETDALAVFAMNEYEIPSPEDGIEIFEAFRQSIANDEKFVVNEKLKQRKLDRVNEQMETLDRIISSTPKDGRQEVLEKLRKNLEEYKAVIENDEATVSVSNLVGGGEIDDKAKYINYAEFGIFVHHVIETLQKETIGTGVSLSNLFTKDKLGTIYKEYGKKFSINGLIENGAILNEDELYNMINEIVSTLQYFISKGDTILPEISIMSRDRFGRNIVGRYDMMAIDSNGKVKIIDIKTKKINAAHRSDSLSHAWPVNASIYTDTKFKGGRRNAYDNWDIQLGVYQRMLESIGVPTDEKIILSLLYAGDYMNPEGTQFDELGNDTYQYSFYKTGIYISSENNKQDETEYIRFKNFMSRIKEVIPVENEVNPEVEEKRRDNIFNLSNEEAAQLLEKLKNITESQLKMAAQKLSEAKKLKSDESIIKYYTDRIQSLNKIKEQLSNDQWEDPYKVATVLKTLEVDMSNLAKTVFNIRENVSDDELIGRAKDLERLVNISVGYNEFLNLLRTFLVGQNASQNEKAREIVNKIQSNIIDIRSVYNKLGFRQMIRMVSGSLAGFQVQRLDEQKKQALQGLIDARKRKRESLAKGESLGLWHRLSSNVGKIFRGDITPKTEIEKLDFEIEKLELRLQGIDFKDDKSIEDYIMAILDPTSQLYIGEGTSYWTKFIAASSSNDLVLSSFANQLKIAMSVGSQTHVNFVESEGIQQELDEYKAGRTNMTEVNEPISEIRTELEWDDEGNEVKVQSRAFINPIIEEYHNIFERHYNRLRNLNEKIRNASDPEEKKDLKKEKSEAIQNHLRWRLQHTQMKFVNEIYELDELLPADYKEKRDELYQEKSLLEQSAGFNNMEDLDDETLYRMAEIEIELNKLRKEYADKEEGGYKKYLDLIEKYYDYEINYNYFNRLLDQKTIELTDTNGNVDIEALNKWKQQNMVKRPTQDWYDAVSDIWDQIFYIIGAQNPAVQELQEKYREILSQYKRKGIIDSRFLTQEDIDTLNEIQELIGAYKSVKNNSSLDFDDRIMLNDLFQSLEILQKREENPFYLKDFNTKIESLDQKWNKYVDEKDKDLKEQALEQFLLEEMEFKTWYDNNHENTYTTRLSSDEGINPVPKKFNLITVPTSDDMYEMVPDNKFTTRRLKPEALNQTYQEDVMGYPMPLGLTRDGALVEGSSQWLSPAYISIRNNSAQSKFYHSFVKRFLDMQEKTVGLALGYKFPGYEQQSLDDYLNNGVAKAFVNRLKLFRDKNLVIGSTYDFSINNYRTSMEDRIQFKHNTTLSIDQQTRDGIGAVIRWYEQAHLNQAMAEVQPISKAMLGFMEELFEQLASSDFKDKEQRMKQLREVIDSMKFEYDKFVKGEWKKDEGLTARYADQLLKAIGFTRLAFDIPNQIGNLLSGNVQAFLGSHKSGLYSSKNYIWAKSKVYGWKDGLIASLMKDYSKVGNRSFMTNMFLYWNPQQQSLDHYYNRTRSTGQRLAQGALDLEASFFLQDKGELEIASTIWLSIMDNIKVKVVASRDENGKVKEYLKDQNGDFITVNVFDAYKQDSSGRIVIRDDVDWTKKDEEGVQRTVWSEIRRTQGRYAEWDKSKVEGGFTGRLLLYYRKYLEPAIRNRGGRLEENWEAGEMAYGFYRALVTSCKTYGYFNTFKSILGFKESSTGVSEFYQRKSQMAAREIAIAASLYLLGIMIKAALPPDEKDDKKYNTLLLNMVAVYAKVDMETRSLVPVPVIGGLVEYIRNAGEFTNAARDVTRGAKLLEHGFWLAFANFSDNKFAQKQAYYQRKYGPYKKGDAKITKDIMDLTGWMNLYELYDPRMRVKMALQGR